MNRNISFLFLFATLVFCATGCQKSNLDEEQVVCQFCGQTFDSKVECLNHQINCDDYEHDGSLDNPMYVPLPEGLYGKVPEIPSAHWMVNMPGNVHLTDLTIPGLHDAATYSYDGSMTPTYVKDQNLDYKDAWNLGVRAFDMRLGYDDRIFQGNFEDRCKFYHGDQWAGVEFGVCEMHNFRIDITGHFPTKEQLKNECMILITNDEYHPDGAPSKINVFEYFMRLLIERYGKDSFIAYSPDLTMNDCTGKIILFTREKEYTGDYSYIGGVPSVPVTYISSFPKNGETNLTVYQYGQIQSECNAYVQDTYNIGDNGNPEKKYNAFITGITNHRKYANHLFFNGMNGVQDKPSWEVCVYMNKKVADDIESFVSGNTELLGMYYGVPLGIVLTDFYGVDEYDHGIFWDERNFSGVKLAKQLLTHNVYRFLY